MKRCLIVLVLLAGCATVKQAQQTCESSTTAFPDFVDCLKTEQAKANGFSWSKDSDLANLYVAYAEALSAHMQKGDIQEYDARLNLAAMYSRMKQISQERSYINSASYANIMSGLAAYNQQPASNNNITCAQNGVFWNCW